MIVIINCDAVLSINCAVKMNFKICCMVLLSAIAFIFLAHLSSAITKECLKNDVLIPEIQKYLENSNSAFTTGELRRLLDFYSNTGGELSVSIEALSISSSAKQIINSRCLALLKNLGEACSVGAECQTGACKNYKCSAKACNANSDCNSDERCITVDRGFLKDFYQSILSFFGTGNSAGNICIKKTGYLKASGQDCQASAECESNFCASNKCSAQPCTSDDQCQTGTCSGKERRIFTSVSRGFGGGGTSYTFSATSFINEIKQKYPNVNVAQSILCDGSSEEGASQTCTTTVSYVSCGGLGY